MRQDLERFVCASAEKRAMTAQRYSLILRTLQNWTTISCKGRPLLTAGCPVQGCYVLNSQSIVDFLIAAAV